MHLCVNLQNLLILKKKVESKEITVIKYKHLYAAVSLADVRSVKFGASTGFSIYGFDSRQQLD